STETGRLRHRAFRTISGAAISANTSTPLSTEVFSAATLDKPSAARNFSAPFASNRFPETLSRPEFTVGTEFLGISCRRMELKTFEISKALLVIPDVKYLILSSDGLYQYFTNQEAVSEVETFISTFPEGDPAQHLVEEVLFRA
ncbi:hypothetical protein M569_10584, partial [Genlisea aurea]